MAAPTFVGVGTIATNVTTASMNIVAPASLANDDILIACVINKAIGNVISPPDGTWSAIMQQDNDCTTAADDHRCAIFWKRGASTDSGASFAFTKVTDDNLLFAGVMSAWRGCDASGSPIDPTAPSMNVAAGASATCFVSSFGPTATMDLHLVAIVFYGNDSTNFTTNPPSGTNPTWTTRFDVETPTGTDASIAGASGDSNGSSTGVRTWASTAGIAAGYTTCIFGLVATAPGGGGVGQPAAKRMGGVPGGPQMAPAGGGRIW